MSITITSQPTVPNPFVSVGGNFTLSVTASSSDPLSYQWYLNDSPIIDATSANYSVSLAAGSDAGTYKVRVSSSPSTYVDSDEIIIHVQIFTNVIPEVDPSGGTVKTGSGTRYFGFSFNTGSATSVNIYAKTNAYAGPPITGPEEQLVSLYEVGQTTNLLFDSNRITDLVSASLNTTVSSATYGLMFNSNITVGTQRNAVITGLTTNTTYMLIMKTKDNDIGVDVALSLERPDGAYIPLTYYSTQNFLNNNVTIDPFTSHTFTNIIPDVDPSGGVAYNVSLRYFGFSFTSPIGDINAFIRSDSAAASTDSIVSLYKSGETINRLGDITNLSNITLSAGNALSVPNLISNNSLIPNFKISLESGATYYIVSKTTSNFTGEDIGLALENSDGDTIPLTYYSTQTTLNNDVTIDQFYPHMFTNIIPDIDPNGGAATTASSVLPRYFGFSFVAPTGDINAFIRSNSSAATSDSIVSLYKSGETINRLGDITNISNITLTAGNALTVPNLLSNNSLIPNFKISLESGATYYIVSKTTSNSTGEDIGLALEQPNGAPILLNYYSTQQYLNNNVNIDPLYLHTFDATSNVIPDIDPSGNAIATGSRLRFYSFRFTTGDYTEIDIFTKTNSYSSVDELITNLYKVGETTNRLSSSTEIIHPVLVSQTSSGLILTSGHTSSSVNPPFKFKNLSPNTVYEFITRTINNDTGADISLLFKKADGTQIPFTYYSTSVLLNLDGTIPAFPQAIQSARSFTDLIPNTAPDGTAFVGGTGTLGTPRYFLWSFNTGSSTSVNVFINSTGAIFGDSILYLYKPGDTVNLLGTKLVNPSGIVIQNNSTKELTFSGSSTNNTYIPSFALTNLDSNTTYKFVMRTTNNATSTPDIGVSFEGQDGGVLSLTYEATSTTMINTTATISVDGTSISQGGSFATTGDSIAVVVTPADSNATYIVNGASGLAISPNNTVTVVVTAADGFTRATTTFSVRRYTAPTVGTLVATPKNGAVDLSWPAVTWNGEEGSLAITCTAGGATVPVSLAASDTSATVSGLTNGVSVTFTLTATNTAGSATATVQASAAAPTTAICFFGNAPVLTPSGYRRIDSLVAGDNVLTADGRSVAIQRATVRRYEPSAYVNPYLIPRGQFGATENLLISPLHRVAVPGRGMIEAHKLGLEQIRMRTAFNYYNLELPNWDTDNLVVGGVEAESLAPIRRAEITVEQLVRILKVKYERLTPETIDLISRKCFLTAEGKVNVPVMKRK